MLASTLVRQYTYGGLYYTRRRRRRNNWCNKLFSPVPIWNQFALFVWFIDFWYNKLPNEQNTGETRYKRDPWDHDFFFFYIRYFVRSVVYKQYKTKQFISLGLEKTVCYIRYFVISDLFILSFYCIPDPRTLLLPVSKYQSWDIVK